MENNRSDSPMSRSRFPDGFRIMKGRQEFVTYIEHSSIRVWYSETPWHFDTHFHSAVEIVVPIRGEVCYTAMDHTYRVQAGEVLILPPNCNHDLTMREGSSRQLLLFEPDKIFEMRDMSLIEPMLKSPLHLTGQNDTLQDVRSLLLYTVECYNRREPLWNSMCYSYLLQMYVLLGQFYMAKGLRQNTASRKIDSEIVGSALQYIDQNYMRSITLEDVAAFSGFSKYYFSRNFTQQMGISFSEYLCRKRVSVAEELLIHSNQSVQDIAAAAGFGSIATFNRVFKQVKKCTPTRYRAIYGDYQD